MYQKRTTLPWPENIWNRPSKLRWATHSSHDLHVRIWTWNHLGTALDKYGWQQAPTDYDKETYYIATMLKSHWANSFVYIKDSLYRDKKHYMEETSIVYCASTTT